jgi:hypothetical protein
MEKTALEFHGSEEERHLAEEIFRLMALQGAAVALDTPIRQSLRNLADYFCRKNPQWDQEMAARRIEAALGKNSHIFAREEREGEVIYMTTRRGNPAMATPAPSLPPRVRHPAPENATATPRRRPVRRPPMSPFWVRTAVRQMEPVRASAVSAPPAEPTLPAVEEVAISAVTVREKPATEIRLPDGTVIDLALETAEIFALHGERIGRILKEALERDFRLISFGDQWYLEEAVEHLSKGRLAEVRRYIQEEGVPLSDETILGDLFFKTPRDPDYGLWAFSLNARLLREKKDFEFVGVPGANLWAVKGLPAIGTRLLKASDLGQDYAFLLEEPPVPEPPAQLEHFLTFYEYRYGVLPYDAQARAFFPPPLLEEQRSAYLTFEVPQHYEAYTVELRYPSGNRGGWLWGLEELFHSSLVPGALILIARTERPDVYTLQYIATDAQERRLLVYDERKERYVFDEITFYCEVEESLLLSEERFGRLRNSKPLSPAQRRRPADVVAHAFTLIGKEKDGQFRATLEELFPVVNIERPFSMAFLQRVLHEVDVFRPADEEGVYLYIPGAPEAEEA